MVSASGVATSSVGRGSSAGGSGLAGAAICWLAAYPHASHRTRVSSPCSLMTMNSWARLPPMIPTSAPTTTVCSPEAGEDPLVRLVVELVTVVQAGLVGVEGVAVLHHELADPDQPATRSGLVAELGLEVVHDGRKLAVRLHDVAEEVGDHLLVGHGQHHVPPAAVLEPDQLGADLLVAARLLPQLGGMDHRHLHLLPADGVHLLADDLLDSLGDREAERQQGVDARAELPDIAGPHEELVRRPSRHRPGRRGRS